VTLQVKNKNLKEPLGKVIGIVKQMKKKDCYLLTNVLILDYVFCRFMHSRLRTHAESVAFFGGGSREYAVRPCFNNKKVFFFFFANDDVKKCFYVLH
jgi:ABC transporter transmembrane region 2